jgi:energy-converting hydrogenase Eha subunit G
MGRNECLIEKSTELQKQTLIFAKEHFNVISIVYFKTVSTDYAEVHLPSCVVYLAQLLATKS